MSVKIRLENLTKQFPGQAQAAVDDLTMDIPEGEIVVLVGPSGCGKTTTMKLINRLIEPSSGRIFLDGEDVTRVNADQLRRRIGYVIQQIGLFPHMTIEDNIATVPKLLGWQKSRISERIDELLETVGMNPAQYRRRYPKELSGGQRQRVGVARALAADPRRHADGRALRRHRPDHARPPAERVPPHPERDQEDDRVRHPRHRRGDQAGGPHRHPARSVPHRPIRHARAHPRRPR